MTHSPLSPGGIPDQLILQKFYAMLDEDIGYGDITTSALISKEKYAKARLFTREAGIAAGMEIASIILSDFNCSVSVIQQDGSHVKANTTLLEIRGFAAPLLSIERTLLNLLQRMCGIATATANLVQKAKQYNPHIRIAATRKTAPLLRYFDKLAVVLGGGDSHRWRLDDAILIKDNHLAFYGDITDAINSARENASFTCPIEIEVSSPEAAITAANSKVDAILIDNMTPEHVSSIVKSIRQLKLTPTPILEVSGNISPENIGKYAKTGVDVISIGWLTHSVPALDLSIDIIPANRPKSLQR
ncbi:MAG: carboxylating nicotinate-nucleotide diphosphorylase [Promethearchaeota archaeon]